MFGIPASGRCAAAIAGAALLWAASAVPASAAVILLIGPAANNVDTSPASVATINTAAGGTIQDIDISIQITGGHMEDWTLELEHLGTVVLLRANKTDHIDDPFDVTFDDEAPSAIGTNNNGTYQPEGSLAAFDGLALAGAWNLRILDIFIPNEGDDLIAWSITATVADGTDVPEPATLALFGLGLAGLGLARRRRAS